MSNIASQFMLFIDKLKFHLFHGIDTLCSKSVFGVLPIKKYCQFGVVVLVLGPCVAVISGLCGPLIDKVTLQHELDIVHGESRTT